MALNAGKIVSRIWGTNILIEKQEYVANMVNVEVPFISCMKDAEEIVKEMH